MRAFSVGEAKAQFSAIINIVAHGDTVTITKRGQPVANIVPANALLVKQKKPKMDLAEMRRFRESMPTMTTPSVGLIRAMRDNENID